MARINVEHTALTDYRIATLGHLLGGDHRLGLGHMVYVWSACQERETYTLSERDLVVISGVEHFASALLESGLGKRVKGGRIEIKGTRGRIEWLAKARANGSKGGRPTKPHGSRKGLSTREPCGYSENNPPAPALTLKEEEQSPSDSGADAPPPVVEEVVSPKDEAPEPERPKTAQQLAVGAVLELCEAAKFCETVSGGRAAKWLAEFGLDLIRETLADGRIDFEGKSPNYLHGVLKTRKAKPSERPKAPERIETFASHTPPVVQKTDEQRRAEYDFYRKLVDRFRTEHPELDPDDPRFEDAIYREKRVPWGYYLALEQELLAGETVQ